MFVLRFILVVFVILSGSSVYAQRGGSGSSGKKFGFRVQYGTLNSTDDEFADTVRSKINSSTPNVKSPGFAAIDFLYTPDAMVYGIRYELFGGKNSTNTGATNTAVAEVESELRGQRLNGLVGWRFLRIQQGYLGLLSHFNMGINSLKYDAVTTTGQGAKQTYTYTGDTSYGYGIALDGAYYADGLYPTGLEIGYTKYAATSFKDESGATVTGSSGKDLQADLSGLYFRFYVGFAF